MDELTQLLTELGDFRGMVHVLEDQILRGKDPQARAELARKVARLWEEQLKDPREAADAWRRVLRMKPGDPDAQAGLERAKSDMLKQRQEETAAKPQGDDGEADAGGTPAPVAAKAHAATPKSGAAKKHEHAHSAEPAPAPEPASDSGEPASADAEDGPAPQEPTDSAVPVADDDEEEILSVDDSELVDEPEPEPVHEKKPPKGKR
jgi:hypothetical protein